MPDLVISGQPVKDEAELRALREVFPTARIVVLADDLSVDGSFVSPWAAAPTAS